MTVQSLPSYMQLGFFQLYELIHTQNEQRCRMHATLFRTVASLSGYSEHNSAFESNDLPGTMYESSVPASTSQDLTLITVGCYWFDPSTLLCSDLMFI